MKFTRRLPKRPVAPTPEGEIGEAAATPSVARQGPAPEIWVIGLIAVIAILLVLFSLVLR